MTLALSEELQIVNKYRKTAPVDVAGIINELGLKLKIALIDQDVSGSIEKIGDTYVITVNAFDPPTRRKFTAAHELGHYFLHRDKIGDGITDNRLYRATEKFQNEKIGKREETQANQFAATLIMPMDLIEELKAQGVTESGELAERLGVSVQAMDIRLGRA